MLNTYVVSMYAASLQSVVTIKIRDNSTTSQLH